MRWWHDGWGGWWILMPLVTVGFWALVIWAVATVIRQRPVTGPGGPTGSARAEEVLAERYARGEIDDEEYRHRLDTLRRVAGGGPPWTA